jgi:hypothetical protein
VEKKIKKIEELEINLDFGIGGRDRDGDRSRDRDRDGCDGIFEVENDQLFNF